MELACRNATEELSEANLVKLLDLWSAGWKHRGRTRAVGPGKKISKRGFQGFSGLGVVVSSSFVVFHHCILIVLCLFHLFHS